MREIINSILALLIGVVFLSMGNTLLNIILPLKMEAAGYSTASYGFLGSVFFAGLLSGALSAKRFIQGVGHIRAFAAFATVFSAVVILHPLFTAYSFWILLRFIGGFCIAGLFAAIEAWLNQQSSAENRGKVLAIYFMSNYMAMIMGQFLVNIWDIEQLEPYLLASLLVSFSLLPVVMTRFPQPSFSDAKPMSLVALARFSPLAVAGSLTAGFLQGALYSLGALYATALGYSLLQTSFFMGAVFAGALLAQYPIGYLADKFDRRSILLLVLVTTIVAAFLLTFQSRVAPSFVLTLVLVTVFGGFISSIYPISLAQVFDYLESDRYVAASSGLLVVYSLGAMLGPLLTGPAMSLFGYSSLFLLSFFVACGLTAFTLLRMRRRESLPNEEQEVVVPVMPEAATVYTDLDPRVDEEELDEAG